MSRATLVKMGEIKNRLKKLDIKYSYERGLVCRQEHNGLRWIATYLPQRFDEINKAVALDSRLVLSAHEQMAVKWCNWLVIEENSKDDNR